MIRIKIKDFEIEFDANAVTIIAIVLMVGLMIFGKIFGV